MNRSHADTAEAPLVWTPGAQRSALIPLDAAAEYLRCRLDRVILPYLIAMLPLSAVVFIIIDAVTAGRRSALPTLSAALVLCCLWRWAWLAVLQRRVQIDIRAEPLPPLRRRLIPILLTRLIANFLLTWGSVLIAPSFYGLYLGGFAAPLILEGRGPAARRVAAAVEWTHSAAARLLKVAAVLAALLLVAMIALFIAQWFIAATVLTSLLGLDTSDLMLTINSPSWRLACLYLLFLIFDLFFSIAAVFLFYDLRAGRLGADIGLRLRRLEQHRVHQA